MKKTLILCSIFSIFGCIPSLDDKFKESNSSVRTILYKMAITYDNIDCNLGSTGFIECLVKTKPNSLLNFQCDRNRPKNCSLLILR